MHSPASRWITTAGLLAILAAGCGGSGSGEPTTTSSTTSSTEAPFTVLDALSDTGRHVTFLGLIDEAGLDQTFRSEGPYTLFAPTDEAFAAMDPGVRDALVGDLDALREAILYHSLVGVVGSEDVTDAGFATTMAGFNIDLRPGVAGLEVNGVPVEGDDVSADNGTIHEIGAVLTVPTVGDVLVQSQEFTNFLTAVEAAGLLEDLRGAGPITLLVPITAGYQRADFDRLNEIAQDPAALERYVRYHIIDGSVGLGSSGAPFTATSRAGVDIEFALDADGRWTAGGVTIVNANVPASNGVIHVLDRVLYPPDHGA